MINIYEVTETNKMVEKENLDVRTITLGINLLDCASENLDEVNEKIYKKITTLAKDLVKTGEEISREIGIPIVNKRISITPISLVGASCCKTPDDYVTIAKTLDKAAHEVGVNFIGGYSAVVSKGMTKSDELLIRSIPKALASTELICSSVNVGSTKTGINMDAVRLMGEIVKETAALTPFMLTVPQSVIYCSVISNSIILKYLLYLILTIIIAIIRHTDIKATIAIPILFNTLSIHPSPCLYNIFFIHLHYAHHNFSHNNNHQFYYKAGCPVFI